MGPNDGANVPRPPPMTQVFPGSEGDSWTASLSYSHVSTTCGLGRVCFHPWIKLHSLSVNSLWCGPVGIREKCPSTSSGDTGANKAWGALWRTTFSHQPSIGLMEVGAEALWELVSLSFDQGSCSLLVHMWLISVLRGSIQDKSSRSTKPVLGFWFSENDSGILVLQFLRILTWIFFSF